MTAPTITATTSIKRLAPRRIRAEPVTNSPLWSNAICAPPPESHNC
jgi:hypothetical protein